MNIQIKKPEEAEATTYDINNIIDEQLKMQVAFTFKKLEITDLLVEIFTVAGKAFRSSISDTLDKTPEAKVESTTKQSEATKDPK